MIGNDVVDLSVTAKQSNWRRKGFLEKVFTATEREQIRLSENQDSVVWLLWSMKEAAYKAHQRKFALPRRIFWQHLECEVKTCTASGASGVIKVGKEEYFSSSEITSEVIFSSAVNDDNIPIRNVLYREPSEMMKTHFFDFFSKQFNIPSQELSLCKNEHGVPFVMHDSRPHFGLFSFTDHGDFSAFSLALMNC